MTDPNVRVVVSVFSRRTSYRRRAHITLFMLRTHGWKGRHCTIASMTDPTSAGTSVIDLRAYRRGALIALFMSRTHGAKGDAGTVASMPDQRTH